MPSPDHRHSDRSGGTDPSGRTDENPPPTPGDLPGEPDAITSTLGPFVAWMATQSLDEPTRRRHRQEVESYLAWCHDDDGPTTGQRRRYEDDLDRNMPSELPAARAGLDQFVQYQGLVARTLPLDPR